MRPTERFCIFACMAMPWLLALAPPARAGEPTTRHAARRIVGANVHTIEFRDPEGHPLERAGGRNVPEEELHEILALPNGMDAFRGRGLYLMSRRDVLVKVPFPAGYAHTDAMSSDGRYLWTQDLMRNSPRGESRYVVHVVDPDRGQVIASVDLPPGTQRPGEINFPHPIVGIAPGKALQYTLYSDHKRDPALFNELRLYALDAGARSSIRIESILKSDTNYRGDDPTEVTSKVPLREIIPVPAPTPDRPAKSVILRSYTDTNLVLDVATMEFSLVKQALPAVRQWNPNGDAVDFFWSEGRGKKARLVRALGGPLRFSVHDIDHTYFNIEASVDGSIVFVDDKGVAVMDSLKSPPRVVAPGMKGWDWLRRSNHYGLVTLTRRGQGMALTAVEPVYEGAASEAGAKSP